MPYIHFTYFILKICLITLGGSSIDKKYDFKRRYICINLVSLGKIEELKKKIDNHLVLL